MPYRITFHCSKSRFSQCSSALLRFKSCTSLLLYVRPTVLEVQDTLNPDKFKNPGDKVHRGYVWIFETAHETMQFFYIDPVRDAKCCATTVAILIGWACL